MQSRWCRRDHLDVGAAGAEQKAALMVLGISSGGIEGACQTGFRDLEGPSTTQLKSQPYPSSGAGVTHIVHDAHFVNENTALLS